MLKRILILAAAVIAGFMAVRVAAVRAWGETRPALAAWFWPTHPQIAVQRAFGEIGAAAARGRAPGSETLDRVRAVAARDPLIAEPLLVIGTAALSRGDIRRAEALLLASARRNPRLPATRYLLADLYLRQSRFSEGLRQVAVLARRLPSSDVTLAPSIAAFARQPGAASEVAALLDQNPLLRGHVLQVLATDPVNASLILALAGPDVSAGGPRPAWQQQLLGAMLAKGDYRGAHRLWRRLARLPGAPEAMLFNPRFAEVNAPPPFNWTLVSGSAGLAEPLPQGGLRVLFYGREQAALASQMLLLQPGSYRLSMQIGGNAAESGLFWVVSCLPDRQALARSPLGQALAFAVPGSGCAAQALELRGDIADSPRTVEVTINDLSLQRAATR